MKKLNIDHNTGLFILPMGPLAPIGPKHLSITVSQGGAIETRWHPYGHMTTHGSMGKINRPVLNQKPLFASFFIV